MNKMIKAAGAAGAAGVLLVGGAGSLAYWNDSEAVPGTALSSGKLELTPSPAAGSECTGWKLDGDVAFANQLLVPGDTLTNICTYTITATGDHLSATVGTSGGGITSAAEGGAAFGTPSASYSVTDKDTAGTSTPTAITEDNDGDTLTVIVSVAFAEGTVADNTTQDLDAVLSDYKVTLTQTHDAT